MATFRTVGLVLFACILCISALAGSPTYLVGKQPEINKTDKCQNHPAHTYQVFVPSVDNSCKKLPLMVVIDPHGDGKLGIKQFKKAAQTYSVVLIASNQIKNNVTGYLQLLDELIADAKSKYPVGNTLYLCGFSGGARMSLDYAISHKINGVIACGALADPEEIKAISCPIIAIIGMDDFNFIEAAQYIIKPADIPQNLSIVTNTASHAWPESGLLAQATGYLRLSAGVNEPCLNMPSLLKTYVSEQNSRLNQFLQSKDELTAMLLARNLCLSKTFETAGSFHSRYEKLVNNPSFIKQRDNLVASLKFELSMRDLYYKALREKDTIWWKDEIETLNMKVNKENGRPAGLKLAREAGRQRNPVFHRIKGYLGVVCYSMCSRAANLKETHTLQRIVPVYRLLEPDNPDQFYYSAVLAHLKKNLPGEKYYLEKAKEKGYQGSLSIP